MSNITTLGNISSIITGPFGSQLHVSDYQESGIPVIMPQNIIDSKICFSDIAYISEENFNRLNRHAVAKNDIIFPRRGDVEKHAYITTDIKMLCGTGCFRVRITNPNVYPLYISMFLNRPETKRWIVSHAVGTNMPNLNTDILSSIPIELPEYEKQVHIANFLQLINGKIYNNEKINNNLSTYSNVA